MMDAVSEASFWLVATLSYSAHLRTHVPGTDKPIFSLLSMQSPYFTTDNCTLPAMLSGTTETGIAVYVVLAFRALRPGFLWLLAPSPHTHFTLTTVLVSATECFQRLASFAAAQISIAVAAFTFIVTGTR